MNACLRVLSTGCRGPCSEIPSLLQQVKFKSATNQHVSCVNTHWSWLLTQPGAAQRWGQRCPQTNPAAGGEERSGEAPLQDKGKQQRSTVVNLPRGVLTFTLPLWSPNLINDVKATTTELRIAATATACQFLFSGKGGGGVSFPLSKLRNKCAHTNAYRIEIVTFNDLASQNYLLPVITQNTFANPRVKRHSRLLRYYSGGNSPVILLEIIKSDIKPYEFIPFYFHIFIIHVRLQIIIERAIQTPRAIVCILLLQDSPCPGKWGSTAM